MKLDTAIELIKEAKAIEANYSNYTDIQPNVISAQKHDDCLRIARQILLEHYINQRKSKVFETTEELFEYLEQ